MATTNLLTAGTTAANSSDFTLAAGESATILLKDAAGPRLSQGATVYIDMKDDAGQYFEIDRLNIDKPAVVLTAIGTFRVRRPAGVSVGVSRG